MKKTASILMAMALFATLSVCAQQPQSASAEQSQAQAASDGAARLATIVSTPTSQWLGSFDAINICGVMQVSLIRIPDTEGPKIVFDTKGSTTTKFKAEVDKKGVLNVTESVDTKRTSKTEVKIYYQKLSKLTAAGSDVVLEQPFEDKMFDLSVSGGAVLRATVNVSDLAVDVTGQSSVVLDGTARYMGLKVSTAKFDAVNLQTMATIADASHGAEVSLFVTERLEATTSTSAKIFYKGSPSIIRIHSSLFGGEILATDK